eukprot:Plantae.Rhodophyta-Purpureofilum_apyrenoidigerum.ctg36728.p1 GENE.Plantae.Rhodophyta-Purpureofilum_apyrenoidigerum.ctg36728~~Plantae.Rhodophyta-Purpureofilum_apyrenoidigerum.ctg36728.p1  ORF type:complete len:331 (+),score=82.44 Plantae.Rhodophyta-Purpureofilum_apyrenoidigerum.ctg36728:96-1088(+)
MVVKVKRSSNAFAATTHFTRSRSSHRMHLCPPPAVTTKVSWITCDVDGTLLNSKHNVDARVEQAIIDVLAKGVKFFYATGKSRQGALNSGGETLERHLRAAYGGEIPGVYLQGLIVYGLKGEIVYEKTMTEEMAWKLIGKAREENLTLVAYNGDRILCEKFDSETEKLRPYKEPTPVPIGKWENVIGKMPIHKFMYLAPLEECKRFRPILEELIGSDAKVTQAIQDMIEVLPPNVSKGAGVQRLIESFNGNPENLMAIGDAENDLEMLKYAQLGVGMGNGLPSVKEVANEVVATNDNAGVAEALRRFVLGDYKEVMEVNDVKEDGFVKGA